MLSVSWQIPEFPIGTDSWMTFTIVLIVLISFIWLVARLVTRVTEDSDPTETDRQMLTAINDLRRKGELSSEEFRSIKSQLVDRLEEAPLSTPSGETKENDQAGTTDFHVGSAVSTSIETQATVVDTPTRLDLPADTGTSSQEQPEQES